MHPIDPRVFKQPAMRTALAHRDVPRVYALLRDDGVSQRRIGELVGQSQSQVCDIIKGRPVLQYDVLARICDGLGVERGWMGLAYAGDQPPATPPEEVDDDVRRRELLAAGSLAAFGVAVLGESVRLPDPSRVLDRVGMADVSDIVQATSALRARARAHGGYGRVVSGVATEHTRMLSASMTDSVRRALGSAIAELHTVAGYCCYDSGQLTWAQHHFSRAVNIGREAGDGRLVADALRQGGLAVQHAGHPNDAAKLYQLGQAMLATAGGDPDRMPTLAPKLSADAAMAYAELGHSDSALSELARARDTAPNADPFERAGVDMVTARVHARLGMTDRAEAFASQAVSTFDARHRRAASSAEITLATLYVRQGEPRGLTLARNAIDDVAKLRSQRARDRLLPLADALDSRRQGDLARHARRVAAASV